MDVGWPRSAVWCASNILSALSSVAGDFMAWAAHNPSTPVAPLERRSKDPGMALVSGSITNGTWTERAAPQPLPKGEAVGHSLSQEVAIVTGAGWGIGHAIASIPCGRRRRSRRLRPDGGGDRRYRRVDLQAGGRGLALHLDVRDAAAVRAARAARRAAAGGQTRGRARDWNCNPVPFVCLVVWRVELDLDRKLINRPAPLP